MASDPLAHPEEAIRRLYAYVSYRIGPGPDAEDVVSTTIERALQYRSTYDPRRGGPGAWLTGIAARCIADHMQGRTRHDLYGLDAPAGYADELATRTVVSADLARALATLDDRGRELVALRYGADLSSKEIGRLLEMRPGAVDVALHRTLARLRAMLDRADLAGTPAAEADVGAGGEAEDALGKA
jgi:RNA polymerase sigma-70 factor (ECF subfamily)